MQFLWLLLLLQINVYFFTQLLILFWLIKLLVFYNSEQSGLLNTKTKRNLFIVKNNWKVFPFKLFTLLFVIFFFLRFVFYFLNRKHVLYFSIFIVFIININLLKYIILFIYCNKKKKKNNSLCKSLNNLDFYHRL